MISPKALGGIQLIGAIIAVILAFLGYGLWAMLLFALIFILMGIHHLTEE